MTGIRALFLEGAEVVAVRTGVPAAGTRASSRPSSLTVIHSATAPASTTA